MSYDPPYTLPGEDPFNARPYLPMRQLRRKRSSLVNKWVLEQQHKPDFSSRLSEDIQSPRAPRPPRSRQTSAPAPVAAPANPYLAYPDMSGPFSVPHESAVTVNMYDLVEDDDLPEVSTESYKTPTTPKLLSKKASRIFKPPSFRNFHMPFHSTSTSSSRPTTPMRPVLPSRRSNVTHMPSTSVSIADSSGKQTKSPAPAAPSSKWRPSVLGFFPASSQLSMPPSESTCSPSRPSVSSTRTYASTAPTSADDVPTTPPSIPVGRSSHTRNRSRGGSSKAPPTLSSASVISATSCISNPQSTLSSQQGMHSPRSFSSGSSVQLMGHSGFLRKPMTIRNASRRTVYSDDDHSTDSHVERPYVAYSGAAKQRVTLSSLGVRGHKKKILVISGIGWDDTCRFEGVKRWCETFGPINQIVRMPGGDLHVYFQSHDVADTVCRLRAQVYISGVGSVQLSWHAGSKR